MAANAPPPSGTPEQSPLAGFDQVSKIVYFHRPNAGGRVPSGLDSGLDSGSSSSPKLILLGGWMDARAEHLAKYTATLQACYPASPILLVRSFVYHFTTGVTNFSVDIAPAVPIIRSIIGDEIDADDDDGEQQQRRRPEMLVLVYSNGGSTILRHLYTLFRETARKGDSPRLPPHVTVFDSAPGGFSFSRSVTAFTLGAARKHVLVRLFMKTIASLWMALYWLVTVPWGRQGLLERLAAAHNARAENQAEVARTYVYSKEDALVDYRFVEQHAAQARERGYEIALERFEGTAHVAHARGDSSRYWTIVRDAWDRWTAG